MTFTALLVLMLAACEIPSTSQNSPPTTPQLPESTDSSPQAGWFGFGEYARLMALPPDAKLLMPVRGVRVNQIANTFGAPRDGSRTHEGQDIFAPKGTPVYSATQGFVWRIGYGELGGNYVFVMGPGGRRYYYAHLDRYAKDLQEGDAVTTGTLLGYVGNTGNARTTPAHLHFGVYGNRWSADERVINPLPLLVNRGWKTLQAATPVGKTAN
ncbi:MAG: M23 family peptidase [Meiothermus sp.]